jgi:hypothetical protein
MNGVRFALFALATRAGGEQPLGSVQSLSHFWFGLSGTRHWLKR